MFSSLTSPSHWLLAVCLCGAFSSETVAQLRLPFQRQTPAAKENNNGTQRLSETSGPWLIMCASFAGDDGMHQAHQLADELSNQYKLATYVYEHKLNVKKELTRNGFRQPAALNGSNVAQPAKRKLASSGQLEVAVLVGDFPSIDDGFAQQVLSTVKTHQPQANVLATDSARDSAGNRIKPSQGELTGETAATDGNDRPLRSAFFIPNPLLPDAYFQQNDVDEFVVKLNKKTKYSLLKNPGNYTVRVATFSGGTKMLNDSVSDKLREMKGGSLFRKSKKASALETALLKATVLTKYLRKHENMEAYEFHDRNASYVCVGSFDGRARTSSSGTEMNPELKAVLEKFTFGVEAVSIRESRGTSFPLPKKLTNVGIACLATPEIVPVPKAPSGSVASRLINKLR